MHTRLAVIYVYLLSGSPAVWPQTFDASDGAFSGSPSSDCALPGATWADRARVTEDGGVRVLPYCDPQGLAPTTITQGKKVFISYSSCSNFSSLLNDIKIIFYCEQRKRIFTDRL
jgi:hypothetical protein